MAYEIKRGFPMPHKRADYPTKYPWGTMNVGDAFVFPRVEENRIRSAAHKTGKALGMKFSIRRLEGGVSCACWRIA